MDISYGIDSVAKDAGVLPICQQRSLDSACFSCPGVLRLRLAGSFNMQEFPVDTVVAFAPAYGCSSIVVCVRGSVALLCDILIYLGMFATALLRLNIGIGRWVLSSALPIQPGARKQKLSAINRGKSK